MTFPPEELRLIDMTVRMFTEPRLLGDQEMLCQAVTNESERKQKLLYELGVSKKDLGSNATFSQLLESLGLEIEYKSGTNGPIPAFAKTDQFMRDLLDSSDPRVADLVEARLACKSSIEETRAGRLLGMAQRGPLCVYLNAYGAHTTRWSGGDGVNWQNLPKKGGIRPAIHAPPGMVIGKVDASQQEARILDTIAGQEDVVQMWREGRDIYCELASSMFGTLITKANKGERQCGKRIKLSAGFGAGGARMFETLKGDMRQFGIAYDVSRETADLGIATYRRMHPHVVQLWKNCDQLLHRLAEGGHHEGLFDLPIEIRGHKIILPNGCPMHYELESEWGDKGLQWKRKARNGWRKIWGGGLTENIVQALGRVAVGQAVLRVERRLGLRPVNLEHDAAVWVFPEKHADNIMKVCIEEMRRPLSWLPECPMDAEGSYGRSYVGAVEEGK
jgi:hypothetical protein